jgi:RNA-directed DNA polymerase
MDKIFELLINIVSANKPKMLTGLSQKARGMVRAFEFRSAQSTIPPVDRQILSHRVESVEHGKPVCSRENGNRPARAGDGQAGIGGRRKRMPSCNEADKGSKFALTRKGAEFRLVLNHKKGLERTHQSGTDRQRPKTVDDPLSDSRKWNTIVWQKVIKVVTRLQARIVKAVQSGDKKKIRDLMRLLARSKAAKLMAVRRVTSNRGKRTAGVDNVKLNTPAKKWQAAQQLNLKDYESKPLRRIYIPKKNGKKRPLGIPTMGDRCEQALEHLALDPAAETRADNCSYGFRKKRSAHDAIEACHNALRLKGSPKWILEGDIKGCFDNINHDWMLDSIPTHRNKLKSWLKSGYMEKGVFNPTENGTPQGGIISPTLANIALDGLEKLLKERFKRQQKVHMVRYADDFIITGESKELLENEVKPLVAGFLEQRGLELSGEKTRISYIDDGFDFLGFNIRKYKGKLLTKPSKSAVKSVKTKIREMLKSNKTIKTENLIKLLNPVIRGWGNYYRHSASKEVFYRIDHEIWKTTWKWAERRHPDKSRWWIKSKYFQQEKDRKWVFREEKAKTALLKMGDIPVRRYTKIKQDANPYDPAWREYFEERAMKQMKAEPRTKMVELWKRQEGICPICQTALDNEEEWHIHHKEPRSQGGKNTVDNLDLLHAVCHRQIHSQNPVKRSTAGCLTVSYRGLSRVR